MTLYRGQRAGQSTEIEPIEAPQVKPNEVILAIYNLIKATPFESLSPELRRVVSTTPNAAAFWSVEILNSFMKHYFLDLRSTLALAVNNPAKLLDMITEWMRIDETKKSVGRSNICQEAQEIEQRFANAIGNIKGIAGQYQDIIKKISSGGDLVELAREMAEKHIEAEVQELKSKLQAVHDVIKGIQSIRGDRIASKVIKARDEIEAMSKEDVVKDLVEKVKGQIAFIISQFKEIRIEEIGHITQRICSITSDMMKPINDRVDSINQIVSRSNDVQAKLQNASLPATNRAIASGAYRVPPANLVQRQASFRNEARQTIESRSDEASYPDPIENEDVAGITPWNNGNGDSKITFPHKLGGMGEEGWIRTDVQVKVLISRVQAEFGKQLRINSAYRSPAYNARQKGSATKSMHTQGKALDVSFAGFNRDERERFIKIALSKGFKGIGRYRTFVHVDIGARREWRG